MKDLLDELQKEFFGKLDNKTSWGKEQIKSLYIEAKNKVLLETLDKNSNKK